MGISTHGHRPHAHGGRGTAVPLSHFVAFGVGKIAVVHTDRSSTRRARVGHGRIEGPGGTWTSPQTSTSAVSAALSSGHRADRLRRPGRGGNTRAVADNTHVPGEAGPALQNGPRPGGRTATRTGHLRLQFWRWVLAPRTTWLARRLAAEFGPGMDARTAWVMARMARHPDEFPYAMQHLNGEEDTI